MIQYLLHASILLAGTFLFYRLVLSRETFFALHRLVLLVFIFLSLTMPLITVPANWSIHTAPVTEIDHPVETKTGAVHQHSDLHNSVHHSDHSAVHHSGNCHEHEHVHAAHSIHEQSSDESNPDNSHFQATQKSSTFWTQIDPGTLLRYIYFVGVGIFLTAFLIELLLLLFRVLSYPNIKDGKYRIVELSDDQAPYSFLNCIFLNPAKYDWNTYNQILEHEKIHIEQLHFFDKFVAELLLVLFWFNPFVWWYRKAISNNLEFLTDDSMLKQGVGRESYQLSLLKVSVPHYPLNLTTNYNQSFLENRIAMMNSKKSSASSSWKYLSILPLFVLSLITLNAVEEEPALFTNNIEASIDHSKHATPQATNKAEKQNTNASSATDQQDLAQVEQTDQITKPEKETLEAGTALKEYSESGTDNEQFSSKIVDENGEYFIAGNWDLDKWAALEPGEWKGRIEGDMICLSLKYAFHGNRSSSYFSNCIPMKEFKDAPSNDEYDQLLEREAGTLALEGTFNNNRGKGLFDFIPNQNFLDYLKEAGMKLRRPGDLFLLFMNDVNREYVSFLQKTSRDKHGFSVDGKDLVTLSAHGMSLEELKEFMGIFESLDNKDYDMEDLMQFKIHNVTPEYVNELRGLGLDLSTENVVQAKIHNVDPEFIKGMYDMGYQKGDMKDMIQYSIHNVDLEDIKMMKELGFDDMSSEDIVQLSIHNVDPRDVQEFYALGYKDMNVQDVVQFSIHNIDPKYLQSFQAAGLKDISKQDIIQAGIHNVDVELIEGMQKAGYQAINMQDIIQFSIHNVDVDYIAYLKTAGLDDLSKNEIVQAKIHNVRPSYIQEFRKLGMTDMNMQDIIQFSIHNIKPQLVKGFQAEGFEGLSHQDIVQAGIHNLKPKYVKELKDLGVEFEDFDELINARIHGVSASFIKRARDKGYNPKTLKEYIRLKIHGI